MNILVYDLEVENYVYKKRLCSKWDPRNYVVEAGWQMNDDPIGSIRFNRNHRLEFMAEQFDRMEKGDVLIGHNLTFDNLWVWDFPSFRAALKRGMRIHCTQLTEYLLQGMIQTSHLNKLEVVAVQYGGTLKIDAVKVLWKQGVLTSNIPKQMLHDYLVGNESLEIEGDIGSTRRVYEAQMTQLRAMTQSQRNMFHNRMESLLATTEMTNAGLYVDKDLGEKMREETKAKIEEEFKVLYSQLPKMPPECTFNFGSGSDLSVLLFGGHKHYSKWTQHTDDAGNLLYSTKKILVSQNRFYKTGKRAGEEVFVQQTVPDLTKPKGAQKEFYFKFNGLVNPGDTPKIKKLTKKGEPLYCTDAEVIASLEGLGVPFLDNLVHWSKENKTLSTYYWAINKKGVKSGMLTLVNDDNLIHHEIHHTKTVTTRNSSSNPNLLNLPRKGTSEVKKMLKSRFGEAGCVVQYDYSAVEVYVQAIQSGDENMIRMLKDNIDFHCYRLGISLDEGYEAVLEKAKNEDHPEFEKYDALRTSIKSFSFMLAYGAGTPHMSKKLKESVETVKKWKEENAAMFPALAIADDKLERQINANAVYTEDVIYAHGQRFYKRKSLVLLPGGTTYSWVEEPAPAFMAEHTPVSFSPTKRKNYPTQGFAGQIMQTMYGRVYRWLLANDFFGGNVYIVNTVYDSVQLDMHRDYVSVVVPLVADILADVRKVFLTLHPELDIPIDFKVDAELGDNMFKLSKFNKDTDYTREIK